MCKDRKTKFRLFGKLEKTKEYDAGAKLLFSTLKQKYYNQFLEAKRSGKKMKIPIAPRGGVSISWDFQCCKYPTACGDWVGKIG